MKRLFVMFYLTYWLSVENSCLGEGQASSLRERERAERQRERERLGWGGVGDDLFIGRTPDILRRRAAPEDHLHIICISIID